MAYKFARLVEGQTVYRHPQAPENPLISVVMPTYKLRGEMNRRAMDSVLNQSCRDLEYILVDDGSSDGLFDLLREYQNKDPRVVILRHEVNSGLPTARLNEGFLLARGKYLAYMFEDDLWLPDALQAMLDTAEEVGKECLVYGKVEYLIHTGDQVTIHSLGAWDFNYGELKHRNHIAACAVLHHRSLLEVCGLPDPHILARRWSDYDMWLRMAKVAPFVRCKQVIARVEAGTAYSLGASVDLDVAFSYRYMSIERNRLLLPSTILDFDIEDIPFVTHAEDAYRVREHYVIPFWMQHPGLLTPGEQKLKVIGRKSPNRVLITKGSYATSIDVTLGNLAKVVPQSVQTQSFFPEDALPIAHIDNFDTVVYHKAIGSPSLAFMERMRLHDKTNIYLLDDNLLKMGTGDTAKEFSYLQPGTPFFNNLEHLIQGADEVFSYSQKISEDVKPLNPRIVEMRNTIREEFILPAQALAGGKSTGRRLKYAIFTGPVRRKELKELWKDFQEFFRRHKNEVEFHLWGLDPSEFGGLACPVYTRGFENSYEKYLQALTQEKFDFMLSPIIDDHDSKRSKTPIKYLEGTAAGAVGIFSDVIVYSDVVDGVTGIKTENHQWLDALERSWQMSDDERVALFRAARDQILAEYTTESQSLNYLAAFEAADLHRRLRSFEMPNGTAKIAYFFHESVLGGATLHLLKHALMARRYGFEPVLCFMSRQPVAEEIVRLIQRYGLQYVQLNFFCSPWIHYIDADEMKRSDVLMEWFREQHVRLVHLVTYSAEVMRACKSAGLPLAVTLHQHYDTPEDFLIVNESTLVDIPYVSVIHSSSLRNAHRWGEVLDRPNFCMRAPIEDAYFAEYAHRSHKELPQIPTILVSGTLQPRKRQLDAIRAIRLLVDRGLKARLVLLGYDNLLPDYAAECREEVRRLGVEDLVEIPGFSLDPKEYYDRADFIMCPSDDESMPQSILKAMASGIRVITTPVGGVKELILDGFSGIITGGYEAEHLAKALERAIRLLPAQWEAMLLNAHQSARMACSEEVVRYQLLRLYNVAAEESANRRSGGISAESGPQRVLFFLRQIQLAVSRIKMLEAQAHRLSLFGLAFSIHVPNNYLNAMIINFGTYLQRFPHPIEVAIREDKFPYRVIRRTIVDGNSLADNEPYNIYFDPIENIAGKNVYVTFRVKSWNPLPLLAVYEIGEKPKGYKRFLYPIAFKGQKLFGNLVFAVPGDAASGQTIEIQDEKA